MREPGALRGVSVLPAAGHIACSWDEVIAEDLGRLWVEAAANPNPDAVFEPSTTVRRPVGGLVGVGPVAEDPFLNARMTSALARAMDADNPLARRAQQRPGLSIEAARPLKGLSTAPWEPLKRESLPRQMTARGMVLLKNSEDVLPLKPASPVSLILPADIASNDLGSLEESLAPPLAAWSDAKLNLFKWPTSANATELGETLEQWPNGPCTSTAVIVLQVPHAPSGVDADRPLQVPEQAATIIERTAASAARTVVVITTTVPVMMPWLSRVDAVLMAGTMTPATGDALAAVLTGIDEPSGRLTRTFPRAGAFTGQHSERAAGSDADVEHVPLDYRGFFEGLSPEPAFWFGHGLGYGVWDYGTARLLDEPGTEAPIVEVEIANLGTREALEIVQVYYLPADLNESVRLVGFTPAAVAAGDHSRVRILCDGFLFRRWDERPRASISVKRGELLIARGLGDIRERLPLY